MEKGRGLAELLFSLTIIFILSGVFVGYWLVNIREARRVGAENQLTNLRYSLELYKMLEGRYPEDLRELSRKYVTIKEDSLYGRRYLESQSHDEDGYPVDLHGHRFVYDNKTGTLKKGGLDD